MTVSNEQQELIDLLRNELAEILSGDSANIESCDAQAQKDVLEELQTYAENFGNAAQLVGLVGLWRACEHLACNFQLLLSQPGELYRSQQELVKSWSVLLLGYLQYFGDDAHVNKAVDELLGFLADPAWPEPLRLNELDNLRDEFKHSQVKLESSEVSYPESVSAEMASIDVGDDVRPELLQGLLQELPSQVSRFDRAVEEYLLEKDSDKLRDAQRIAHTLKGSANIVGIQGMANLMHYVEDLLIFAEKNKSYDHLGYVLMDAADCLSAASEFLSGLGPKPDNLQDVIQSVLDLLKQFSAQKDAASAPENSVPTVNEVVSEVDQEPDSEPEVEAPETDELDESVDSLFDEAILHSVDSRKIPLETSVRAEPDVEPPVEADKPVLAPKKTIEAFELKTSELEADKTQAEKALLENSAGTIYSHSTVRPTSEPLESPGAPRRITVARENKLPDQEDSIQYTFSVAEDQAQELLRLAGEQQIANTQLLGRVSSLVLEMKTANSYHARLRQLSIQLERLAEQQSVSSTVTTSGSAMEDELDPLELERYNELNSLTSELQELTTDAHEAVSGMESEFNELKNSVLQQRQMGFESQDILMGIRMIPVSLVAPRFQRCVRQASRITGKHTDLEILGEDVQIDSRVLNSLVDPIMHLLRNAVDHGLEYQAERLRAGKSDNGKITLEFKREGDSIEINCADDGRGLDYEAILKSARAKAMLPDDIEPEVSELNQLILSPGFSTRKEATQTSGRGIGLDVVNEQVRQLKGSLTISSEKNKGTRFSISAPTSILSAHTLIVRLGSTRVSVLSRGLEQVVFVEPHKIEKQGEKVFYRLSDEERIPVYHLDELLVLPQGVSSGNYSAMMVSTNKNGERRGVLAESISASDEQIIKPLSQYTFRVPGVVGATILEDGTVSPVVDLLDLSALSLSDSGYENWRKRFEKRIQHMRKAAPIERPMALVVDDSLSARRSLAQFIQDLGMEVCTAKDGFEAIQVINERVPSVILVDLEMPRMNGLELASHVRANDSTKNIPIIMITSRATAKHKNMAIKVGVNSYVNKPWTDEELLSTLQSQIA